MPYRTLKDMLHPSEAERARGVWSACTAHPLVLEAVLRQGLRSQATVLIEATASQVNPAGGYSGLTPEAFGARVRKMAREAGLPSEGLILGADHLGPYPWRGQSAPQAMARAAELVRACLRAGFRKLHLDGAVVCAGDPREPNGALPRGLAVERTVQLCRAVAEAQAESGGREWPWLVVGTDTPVPGGGQAETAAPAVTTAEDLEQTLDGIRQSLAAAGLEAAWPKVTAVVVQPGMEFYPEAVRDYEPRRTRDLVAALARHPHLVFEAHSTDFQRLEALERLVADRFAILKVGPRLTFALREAVEALAAVEAVLARRHRALAPAGVMEALEAAMQADPSHWREHYRGSETDLAYLRRYGLSDRIRYYWAEPSVAGALERLLANLDAFPPPWTLLSRFLPRQAEAVHERRLANRARELIRHRIMEVTEVYARACGLAPDPAPGPGSPPR